MILLTSRCTSGADEFDPLLNKCQLSMIDIWYMKRERKGKTKDTGQLIGFNFVGLQHAQKYKHTTTFNQAVGVECPPFLFILSSILSFIHSSIHLSICCFHSFSLFLVYFDFSILLRPFACTKKALVRSSARASRLQRSFVGFLSLSFFCSTAGKRVELLAAKTEEIVP